MIFNSEILFLEINNSELKFFVGKIEEDNKFEIIYKNTNLINTHKDLDSLELNIISNIIKENIFLIEQKLNITFKELVLVIDNFSISFTNLCGFKRLNGSQLSRENITYILNACKSSIDKFEKDKTIIHIFNSKYLLDGKQIDNLPIGLFGDFYSQELVFFMACKKRHENINKIFEKCNLRVKKILLKSFIDGVNLIEIKKKKLKRFLK